MALYLVRLYISPIQAADCCRSWTERFIPAVLRLRLNLRQQYCPPDVQEQLRLLMSSTSILLFTLCQWFLLPTGITFTAHSPNKSQKIRRGL